jgi:hypothetical protein
MKFQDLTQLLEQDGSLFQPRRVDDRQARYDKILNQTIQDYIKNGSHGDLTYAESDIKDIPNNLKYVGGYFGLSYTQITSLPDGLTVEESLDLSNTPIKKLPKGLKVGGDLFIDYTQISSLPEDLQVEGDLTARGTPFSRRLSSKVTEQEIDKMFPNINGFIYL